MTALLSFLNPKDTFAHGVHPPERKELAENAEIEILPTPKGVRVPLHQHVGAPCELAVKPSKPIEMNDVIGVIKGLGAPIHASISGKSARPSVATLPNGRHVETLPIKAGDEQPLEGRALFDDIFGGDWPTDGFEQYEPMQIVDAARDGGLVGLGGAAFPMHVKITPNEKKPIDTILVNGSECEPYLTSDYRLMVETPAPIVTGALLAQRATGAKRVIICIENNKPKAIATMRNAVAGTNVEVKSLKTKYPQGGEKQLIDAVMGKEVPLGGLPLDIGIVVINVATSAALARAVVRGKPLTHRVVTVTGNGIQTKKNVLAPIGASYQDIIDFCGGLTEDAARVLAGGPMMGFAIGNLDTPLTKGTGAVTVLTHKDIRRQAETACIRCGRCVDVCPMYLVPTRLALAVRADDADMVSAYHINACMECGCCAYTCPASIPLVQLLRQGKVLVQKKN